MTDTLPTDPQAALELGCRIVATADIDGRGLAESLFEIAQEGDPTTVWHAAEAYARQGDGRAARWMAEGAASLGDPEGISVYRQTLPIRVQRYDKDRWTTAHQDWHIAVRCDDPDRAVVALRAAVPRLSHVANDGSFVPDFSELAEPSGPWYTPNYVAVNEDVPLVWLDCKGEVYPLMARTVIQVVVEELRTVGITRAELSTPRRVRD